VAVFAVLTSATLLLGGWGIEIIKSSTRLLDGKLLFLLFLASLFEALTYLSTSVLLSRNAVPHYKAQSITAVVTMVTLLLVMEFASGGVLTLIFVPMATQLVYQHWRWTLMVFKELKIGIKDYLSFFKSLSLWRT
jgi:hypothetical protein